MLEGLALTIIAVNQRKERLWDFFCGNVCSEELWSAVAGCFTSVLQPSRRRW